MINKQKLEPVTITHHGVVVTYIIKGAVTIWEAINSCFGKGYWLDNKPWNDKDSWKD